MSAKSTFLFSVYDFAKCFYNGLGTDIDREKAFNMCKLAINKNYAPAINRLGDCYFYGQEVPLQHKNERWHLYNQMQILSSQPYQYLL